MWNGGVRVVISNDEGKILFVRQRHEDKEIWMVPGGAIEAGETSQDAAIREVLEETGLVVDIERLLWHVEEVNATRGQRFVNYFFAKIIGGKVELGTDPELGETQVLDDIGFFSKEDIAEFEHVYPDALREEIWEVISGDAATYDAYRIR